MSSLDEAVARGMTALKYIVATHAGRVELQPKVLAEATNCMVGILAVNGYMGRKREWEVCAFG